MIEKAIKILCLTILIVMFGCAGGWDKVQTVESIPVELALDVTVNDKECTKQDKDLRLDPENNGKPKISQLSWIMGNHGYVKIFSGLSVADVTRLWNDLTIFEWLKLEDVTIFLNSPGGDAFSGLALSNHIMDFIERGMMINIEASGIVASAAVPVLAVGVNRSALPGTIFMVHEAALWKWPGRETASDIRSQNELMTLLRNEYIGILADHTTTPFADWEEMEGRTTWFNVNKARDLGLID